MEEQLIDLSAEKEDVIEGLRSTPGSALGSCRYKLQTADFPRIMEVLQKYNIRYFFLIGGNDTMDTIYRVESYCHANGYEMIGVGVPKTVDNDLFGTDHTPGFASAARFVALSVKEAGVLARDMQKVDQFVVHQTVGRDAGWLAASSILAKEGEDDAPHIILIPERAFDLEKFLARVKVVHDKIGWVSVVCGEGVRYADGSPISASRTADKFANIEFGAMGGTSIAVMLHHMIAERFGWRGEFQITESLPMCAMDRASLVDLDEAWLCGVRAVELAANGQTGVMVSIVRESNDPYTISFTTALLRDVAVHAKPMPGDCIDDEFMSVTEKCVQYLRPLVGPLPRFSRLVGAK